MKILFLLGITRPASQQRMSLNHHTLLYIILYPASFYSIATGIAALPLNYFIVKSCPCAGLSQNKYSERKTALLKPRLSAIGLIFYVHSDDINTCVRNQQDYTLGLFEWVEEGFRVRMCEEKKKREGETIWLSCIYGSYIPSSAMGLLVNHFACL